MDAQATVKYIMSQTLFYIGNLPLRMHFRFNANIQPGIRRKNVLHFVTKIILPSLAETQEINQKGWTSPRDVID